MTNAPGATFTADENAIADRVQAVESALFLWACGQIKAGKVRKVAHDNGVDLLDRLNPAGSNRVDAHAQGYGPITLTF